MKKLLILLLLLSYIVPLGYYWGMGNSSTTDEYLLWGVLIILVSSIAGIAFVKLKTKRVGLLVSLLGVAPLMWWFHFYTDGMKLWGVKSGDRIIVKVSDASTEESGTRGGENDPAGYADIYWLVDSKRLGMYRTGKKDKFYLTVRLQYNDRQGAIVIEDHNRWRNKDIEWIKKHPEGFPMPSMTTEELIKKELMKD